MKYQVVNILSPAHFLLTPCFNQNLLNLQDELKTFVTNSALINRPLEADEEVITMIDGVCERAIALKQSVKKRKLLIHYLNLVDKGVHKTAFNAYSVPRSTFNKIPFAAFIFRLYGIFPKEISSIDEWPTESKKIVEEILNLTLVELKIEFWGDNFVSGDIVLTINDEPSLLSRVLTKKSYAVYNEQLFKEKYGARRNYHLQEIQSCQDYNNDSKSTTPSKSYDYDSDSGDSFVSAKSSIDSSIEFDSSAMDEFCSNSGLCSDSEMYKSTNSKYSYSVSSSIGKVDNFSSISSASAKISKYPCPRSNIKNCQSEALVFNSSNHKNSNESQNVTKPLNSTVASSKNIKATLYPKCAKMDVEKDENHGKNLICNSNILSESIVSNTITDSKGHPSKNISSNAKNFSLQSEKIPSGTRPDFFKAKLNGEPNRAIVPPPTVKEVESQLLRYYRILVRSSLGEITPVLAVNEFPINEYINSVLRRGRAKLFPVQSYCITSIVQGQNTVIISNNGSGKTHGYIIPVANSLHLQSEKNTTPLGYGPLAIILCSGSKHVQEVFSICEKYCNLNLTPGKVKTRIFAMHGSNEKDKIGELTNGCEILITTPHCLVRTLRGELATNLERLQFFIIDNTDFLLEPPFQIEVELLLKKMEHVTKTHPIQWILAGENYTPKVRRILNSFKDYTLIIGSHIEAAIYSNIQPTLIISKKLHKVESLLETLEPIIGNERIVIACRSGDDAQHVGNELNKRKILPIIAHTGMRKHIEIANADEKWKKSNYPILVCSDSVLDMLTVYDATVLIHFSLPVKHKTTFGLRFSVLMNNYRNHFHNVKSEVPLRSIVIVDEETQRPIPHIIKDLLRLGCAVNKNLIELSEKVKEKAELIKPNLVLCSNIMAMGSCGFERSCRGRHVIDSAVDTCHDHKYGQVVFEPIQVLSGNCFSARLISNTEADGKTTQYKNLIPQITAELKEYYENLDNRMRLGMIQLGDKCAVSTYSETFFRGRVEQCLAFDENKFCKTVRVRLIDVGTVILIEVLHLWYLPENLAVYPDQSVVAYIMGIAPLDFDYSWSKEVQNVLASSLLVPLEKDYWWQGTARFALRSGLVLENVCLVRSMKELRTTSRSVPVSQTLLDRKLAVKNPNHYPLLLQLHKKGGITPPKVLDKRLRLKPKYAHFEGLTYLPVTFSAASGTNCVYVQNTKYASFLCDLQNECRIEGEKMLMKKNKYLIEPGNLCLAKNYYTQEWNRAEVKEIDYEKEWASCFFVDYGDEAFVPLGNLIPITENLVSKLPFQAIKCSLGGIQHPEQDIVDAIYDFAENETCYAACIERRNQSLPFEINLLNSSKKSLNRELVDSGLVKALDETCNFLKDNLIDTTTSLASEEANEKTDDEEESEEEEDDTEEILRRVRTIASLSGEEDTPSLLDTKDYEDCNPIPSINADALNKLLEKMLKDENYIPLVKEYELNDKDQRKEDKESQYCKIEKKSAILNCEPPTSAKNEPEYGEIDCDGWILVKPKPALRPLVQWSQDSYYIKLKFIVLNVKDIKVQAADREFCVTLLTDTDACYRSTCEVFGGIRYLQTSTEKTPFYCTVIFPKLVPTIWPRLTLSLTRDSFITIDPEYSVRNEFNDYQFVKDRIQWDKTSTAKPVQYDTDDSDNELDEKD